MMIAIVAILALTAVFIAALAIYWKNIVEWVKKAATKVKEVHGEALKGVRTFITRTQEGLKNISKNIIINQLTHEYEEVVYTKSVVDESEVPDYIREKVYSQPFDTEVSITEELSLVISG